MYTTVGRLKGCCNHEHDTRDEAESCLFEHTRKMRTQGQITDRVIVEIESLEELEDQMEIY